MADVWYPSCKVQLKFRFEDFVPAPTEATAPNAGGPNYFGEDAFDTTEESDGVVITPHNVSLTLNSYREADQCSITIPFDKFPLDPRIIRACAVQVFMGGISAQEFSDSIGPIGGRSSLALVPDLRSDGGNNEVFRGKVDTWKANWEGDDTITMECRDLTSVFLDHKMPTQGLAGVPGSLPLDKAIELVVQGQPPASNLAAPEKAKVSAAIRQDPRGVRRRLSYATQSVTTQLAAATSAAASNPGDTQIAAEVVRLTQKKAVLDSTLAEAIALETASDSIPIVAQNFGLVDARGFRVVNETGINPLPSFEQLRGAKWMDSKKAVKKSRSAGSKDTISYWDFITDLCVSAGFIVFIRTPRPGAGPIPGTNELPAAEIVISTPRVYYGEGTTPPGVTTPPVREFFYGKNTDTIEVSRKIAGKSSPTAIEVRARVEETGRPISARFPPRKEEASTKANRASPGGKNRGDREELDTLLYGTLPEANAEENLQRLAESLYEQRSRGEFEITVRTKSLNALPENYGTGNIDMFQLRAGDTVKVGVALADPDIGVITTPGLLRSLPIETRMQIYQEAGLNRVAAARAAAASDSAHLQEFFRVQSVGVDFDKDRGYDFEVACINYLDVRHALENVE